MNNELIARFRTLSEDTSPEEVARVVFPGNKAAQQAYVHYCRSRGWV